jgi:carbonic anhydrase/acetyltransferase-like protein (isoleucine patch superfamily)
MVAAMVTLRKIVRRREPWAGNPAQKLRGLTEKDFETFRRTAAGYVELARAYREPPARMAE